MRILAARKYPNPRNGSLSRAEVETRRLAYAIKDPRSPARDFDTAAREMARLIETPCWLVPIPASDGSTRANTILAAHIARRFQLSAFSVSAFALSSSASARGLPSVRPTTNDAPIFAFCFPLSAFSGLPRC